MLLSLFALAAAHPKDCCVSWVHSGTMMSIGGSLSQGSTSPEMNDVSRYVVYMSRVTTKLVFGVSDQVRHKPGAQS